MDQDWNYIQIQNKLLWMADLVITDRNDANCKVPLRFLIRVKFLQERWRLRDLAATALLQKCRNGSFEKPDELSIYKSM